MEFGPLSSRESALVVLYIGLGASLWLGFDMVCDFLDLLAMEHEAVSSLGRFLWYSATHHPLTLLVAVVGVVAGVHGVWHSQ